MHRTVSVAVMLSVTGLAATACGGGSSQHPASEPPPLAQVSTPPPTAAIRPAGPAITAACPLLKPMQLTAGFGRVVGLHALTVPHGIAYSKFVIVVDDTVDPFNLEQVMWALSAKFNPEFDAIIIPRMYEVALDPAGHPQFIPFCSGRRS